MPYLPLVLSLLTLKAGEKAISYGGFANEIIRHSRQAKRIDNSLGQIVIENDRARELFNQGSILSFCKTTFQTTAATCWLYIGLKTLFKNLSAEKVTLALKLGDSMENETWFEISLKPISLKKPICLNIRLL